MAKETFSARFWGSRGTLASFSEVTREFGGNTSCVEVQCGKDILILDAGSGLRLLGDEIMRRAGAGHLPEKLHLFFTHCHYDHISGLPFFAPFFDPSFTVDIWSGHLDGPNKTKNMILSYMKPPFFPVGPEVFTADLTYCDFEATQRLKPQNGIEIETLALNHHDGCIGYRINFDGRSICFITDTTHIPDEPDMRIVEMCRDTDLMIYDGMYTDAEFPKFWNFGHSTWQEGLRLAKMANAKRYVIFHHRPSRTDTAMIDIESMCQAEFKQSWAAREGQIIEV